MLEVIAPFCGLGCLKHSVLELFEMVLVLQMTIQSSTPAFKHPARVPPPPPLPLMHHVIH